MLRYIWSLVSSFIHLLIKILLVSLVHSSIIYVLFQGFGCDLWPWPRAAALREILWNYRVKCLLMTSGTMITMLGMMGVVVVWSVMEKKWEISYSPLRHLNSELQKIRYTHTWKKNSADDSKAAQSDVKNYAIWIRMFRVIKRQPSILVINSSYFLLTSFVQTRK